MNLPNLNELRALLELCKSQGVAAFKSGEVEFTFLPQAVASQMAGAHRSPTAEELADEDDEESRYQKELASWRKSVGRDADDDKGVDG